MSLASATSPPSTELDLAEPGFRTPSRLRIVLFPARAFLALGWIRAGVEKIVEPNWWNGTSVRDFLDQQSDAMLPFLLTASETVGARAAVLISFLVLIVEVGIGLCLITGRRLAQSLVVACALNVAFVALGAVTPSAFYLVLQMTLLFALYTNRPQRSAARERLGGGLLFIAGVAVTPFIRTLHPHEVIEDPAIMLATLALLTAATLTIISVEAPSSSAGAASLRHESPRSLKGPHLVQRYRRR